MDSAVVEVVVGRDSDTVWADAVELATALELTGGEHAHRTAAITLLELAAASFDPAVAIQLLLDAIDEVRAIDSVDVTDLRIELARLLRVYQMRWTP